MNGESCFAVSVTLEDGFLGFNRLVGVVRRRNLAIESFAVGAGREAGLARLTVLVRADADSVRRLAGQLGKLVGVRSVAVHPEAAVNRRMLGLIKVRTTGPAYAEVLDTAARFGATVLEEGDDEIVIEVTGDGPLVLSLVRALEPYGVVDVARSGIVALSRPAVAAAPIYSGEMKP